MREVWIACCVLAASLAACTQVGVVGARIVVVDAAAEASPADAGDAPDALDVATDAPAFPARTAAAGSTHTCAIDPDGGVWCWGGNDRGQLGDGTTSDRSSPVRVAGLTGARSVATGGSHSCAVVGDGTVRCWGDDFWDQCGVENATAGDVLTTPTQVAGLAAVVETVAGANHTCARLTDGSVWCWGASSGNEVGTVIRSTAAPVRVPDVAGAIALASSNQHTCALVAGGGVRCWGQNFHFQLGSAITATTAVIDPGVTGATAIAVGYGHSCALVGGQVLCWGDNSLGQLGNVTSTSGGARARPAPVDAITAADAITSGANFACARQGADGTWCWGDNTFGQLATGDDAPAASPVRIASLDRALWVSAGFTHACGDIDGALHCWGDGYYGQVGGGRVFYLPEPTIVPHVDGVARLALGGLFSCALRTTGSVACWGGDRTGELGTIGLGLSFDPVEVRIPTATQVSAGLAHACAVLANHQVMCWGSNSSGQIGNGSATFVRSTPTVVRGITDALQVSCGASHTCALVAGGVVTCWGSNASGQLGTSGVSMSVVPALIAGLTDVVEVSAGQSHTCARRGDGRVWCWGDNGAGELGDGTMTTRALPSPVTGLADAVLVAAGARVTCALHADATVSCWGSGQVGELGDGNTGSYSAVPAPVPGLDHVAQLAMSSSHVCARREDRSVACWGHNRWAQTGRPSSYAENQPRALPPTNDAIDVAVGGRHSCLVSANGVVRCWGDHYEGELGIATWRDQYVLPTRVR